MEEVVIMKTRKVLSFVLMFVLCLSFGCVAFADGTPANSVSENETFLLDKGVPTEELAKMNQSDMNSLAQQAKAYRFTDDQIQSYAQGRLSEPLISAQCREQTYRNKSGAFKTSANEWPDLFANWKIPVYNPAEDTNRLITRYRNFVSADQTGTYWSVVSKTGYLEATTFLDVPTISDYNKIDTPYMMISANTNPTSVGGDYGIGYSNGSWVPDVNFITWNPSTREYKQIWCNGVSGIPSSITHLYIDVKVELGLHGDSVTYLLFDGNNLSNKLFEETVIPEKGKIYSNGSNLNLHKTVSMAQTHDKKTNLNTNTGTWLQNAKFNDSVLYNDKGYWCWGPSQTSDVYREAPTSDGCNTVVVNSVQPWHQDDVSIRFNRK